MSFAGSAAPEGWLICDGSSVSKASYSELFSAVGYTYGGSGDSFNLPNYADRLLIGAGATVTLAGTAGADDVTLTTANLPAHSHAVTDAGHSHTFTGTPHSHGVTDPGHSHTGTYQAHTAGGSAAKGAQSGGSTDSATTGITIDDATAGGTISSATTGISLGSTGDGTAVNILNPVVGVNWIIKT